MTGYNTQPVIIHPPTPFLSGYLAKGVLATVAFDLNAGAFERYFFTVSNVAGVSADGDKALTGHAAMNNPKLVIRFWCQCNGFFGHNIYSPWYTLNG